MARKNNVIEGQMSIFDFLAPPEPPKIEYETPEADKLRANGWKNMYDETPPVGFYEVCDINKPNRIWVTECNKDGSWWNPNGLRMSWWRPLTYKSDEEIYREAILHGSGFAGGKKRIIDFFASEYDDKKRAEFLKNEYGVGGWTTDYGCVDHNAGGLDFSYKEEYKQANKRAKLVHSGWPMVAKEIEYLIQRGIYTAEVCKFSEHTCNKEELWRVALEIGASCPKSCCRVCDIEDCGARCNGSEEPEDRSVENILLLDPTPYARERIYLCLTQTKEERIKINCLKHEYKEWDSPNQKRIIKFDVPEDNTYIAGFSIPVGLILMRNADNRNGSVELTWNYVLHLIEDMIEAGEYIDIPPEGLKPNIGCLTCKHDSTSWCNRFAISAEEQRKAAPINGGSCKWECRVKK